VVISADARRGGAAVALRTLTPRLIDSASAFQTGERPPRRNGHAVKTTVTRPDRSLIPGAGAVAAASGKCPTGSGRFLPPGP